MQCATIASELGYTHLSTGDLLREEQAKGSELATEIEACIRCDWQRGREVLPPLS